MFASGAVIVASLGVTAPAQAVISTSGANIIEGHGVCTFVNNSALDVYECSVTNPAAANGAATSTAQAGWYSFTCLNSYFGNSQPNFGYYDVDAVNDIGPGQSSSKFFFAAPPASDYRISLRDANGGSLTTVTGTAQTAGAVPEPATWALMMIGLGAAGTALRRRRFNGMASVTA